ncbi:MAG TPA: hypothetical protein VFA99_04235 [Acidobacteriaceae bacterium]|nr:hypothetical protein [Acidobacteriaceae bacterium]
MRGIKNSGVDEVDLLGVRPLQDGHLEAWHVEVQISFSPVAYISQLCKAEQKRSGRKGGSAITRSPEVLAESVAEWIHKKFDSPKKHKLRNQVWPELKWKKVFVHAIARHPEELKLIEQYDVILVTFRSVLDHLIQEKGLTGASGTDISDIIRYYGSVPTAAE